MASLPGRRLPVQGGQHSGREIIRAEPIEIGIADSSRREWIRKTGHLADSTESLRRGPKGSRPTIVAKLSEAGLLGIDDPGIELLEALVAQAHPLHRPWREALDDDVHLADEGLEDLLAAWTLQV